MGKKVIEVFSSDDYAFLNADRFTFYYGYEEMDVETEEWCFTVSKDKKEILRLKQSEIEKNSNLSNFSDVKDYLLIGIGLYLSGKK